jgi:superfamily II RNA helicase
MVKHCSKEFQFDNIDDAKRQYCEKQFSKFPFELDHFQKHAVVGIETGKHVLVTAHTGSGKTLASEYAIKKFCSNGKKVIYTGPIKSLSNQKYHEFSQKYPEISFGIMTGDIKFNPEADCLIMTTEILRNALYNSNANNNTNINNNSGSKSNNTSIQEKSLDFNLDIENDVACVVFDEVHYINDQDRGKVWEECIMNMPNQIQMVMLSATIDREYQFAQWIETIKQREVWIASTHKRVVPLTHYMYYLTNTRFDKHISQATKSNTATDLKTLKQLNKYITDKFVDFKDPNAYSNVYKLNAYIEKNGLRVNKQDVLNRVVRKLHTSNMLPAICFVFSRKQVERYANYIETNLFEIRNEEGELEREEHKKSNTVEKECKQILMKFPNYQEYINLPEYHTIVQLLKKGIAIHHSGILPVLREMIELMFDKGYVKLLFATETFAVGINMPTKTVLFTSLSKFSNSGFRYVLPHEYTQMAGRAGRRGLDSVGHVIHLNNLFELPDIHSYKQILSGNPQTLISKFKTEPQLILKLFETTNTNANDDTIMSNDNTMKRNVISYLETSMNFEQQNSQLKYITQEINTIEDTIQTKEQSFSVQNVDINTVKEYVNKTNSLQYLKPKKRKVVERELSQINARAPRNFDSFVQTYNDIVDSKESLDEKYAVADTIKKYCVNEYEKLYQILHTHEFIHDNKLTSIGKIASNINELNSIVISSIIHNKYIDNFDVFDLIIYASLFTQIRVSEDSKQYKFDPTILQYNKNQTYSALEHCIHHTEKTNEYYFDVMMRNEIDCNQDDYLLCYDVYDLVNEWCYVENETDAKYVISKCYERDIFIGEFVKCLLKIVNITNELNSVALKTANVKLQYITSQVEEKLLKYVATNQSLYV